LSTEKGYPTVTVNDEDNFELESNANIISQSFISIPQTPTEMNKKKKKDLSFLD
jgi:hypothetical protein